MMEPSNLDPRKERMGAVPEGLRDWGSFHRAPAFDDTDYAGHRSDQAIYIGLHLPKSKRRHHHHRRRSSKTPSVIDEECPSKPPATPPEQRVRFILGQEAEDEDEKEAHEAHDIFCEMSELFDDGEEDSEWKETARWVKFEEDVEEGGERWSKPHVATLSLYSLFELRKCLLNGTVLLDTEAYTLSQVADLILDHMIANKQLEEQHRESVRDALLRRHRHLHDKKHRKEGDMSHRGSMLPLIRSLADIGKKRSEPSNMNSGPLSNYWLRRASAGNFNMHRTGSSSKMSKSSSNNLMGLDLHTNSSVKDNMTHNDSGSELHETPSSHKMNVAFMKKIPPGAEASNILVGEVEFLKHPIIAFVRLNKASLMGDLTEVPVPTRFLFILLGPKNNEQSSNYHEIGRSIATLMSDEIFHDVAYKARKRNDLLAGVDEFLSNCTVLPPGEWDPTIRIEPPKSVPSQESRKTPTGSHPNPSQTPNGNAQPTMEHEDHGDATLIRTGRFFGGLIDDVKRKAPFYASDFKDALHIQSIASFIFLYFACLTPIITFGGLLGDATGNNMAALESILAGAICGVVYALFAGQPLTILGSTGPVLVFETITYKFCSTYGLDYLGLRWWIGLWTALILIIMVAFDLSALVRYITRFTEESFAVLISLIFIFKAFEKLAKVLEKNPINLHPDAVLDYECYCMPKENATNASSTIAPAAATTTQIPDAMTTAISYVGGVLMNDSYQRKDCLKHKDILVGSGCSTPYYHDNVFFLSVILFFGTFCIAMGLKAFRTGRFLPNMARQVISDFSVLIAILAMAGLDAIVGVATPKLDVPNEFRPTLSTREWVIHPFGHGKNPWWTSLAAILPALLATILIFMDQQITAVIVNRKENKLKKGSGYHLDLFLVALLIAVCSVLGLPWFVAATVLSINHVMSLKKESKTSAPGERPQFLGVREQRVTGICIFLAIGLSVLITFVLRFIPMPVLYGVFLYMGVSSLKGIEFVNRLMILFMPPKYQPDYMYLRHVPTKRVHMFTLIQIICLVILWVIKTIQMISIAFPIMVLAICFIRKALDWVFTQRELSWLDDIMPEISKREKEDAEKKKHEEVKKRKNYLGNSFHASDYMIPGQTPKNSKIKTNLDVGEGGNVEIPLSDGNVMSIPVEKITYKPETRTVNISEEMAKTAIWKQIAMNAEKEKIGEKKKKEKKKKKKRYRVDEHEVPLNEQDELDANVALEMKPVNAASTEKGHQDEMVSLMAPDIVVEPPTPGQNSPEKSNNSLA
ncbi:sodium-driven chloride bicarbonate exchanger-like [Tubulanus polymorphus]|uniref:sodium-driven chloride bicarbonate exchanger-like n=1 Tax=Tubulanus polymorphus TaxID=672921 RepID=UPI003DA54088